MVDLVVSCVLCCLTGVYTRPTAKLHLSTLDQGSEELTVHSAVEKNTIDSSSQAPIQDSKVELMSPSPEYHSTVKNEEWFPDVAEYSKLNLPSNSFLPQITCVSSVSQDESAKQDTPVGGSQNLLDTSVGEASNCEDTHTLSQYIYELTEALANRNLAFQCENIPPFRGRGRRGPGRPRKYPAGQSPWPRSTGRGCSRSRNYAFGSAPVNCRTGRPRGRPPKRVVVGQPELSASKISSSRASAMEVPQVASYVGMVDGFSDESRCVLSDYTSRFSSPLNTCENVELYEQVPK